jgi:hypothetical protein
LAGSCGKEEEGRRPGATGIAAARGLGEVERGKEKGRRRGGTDRRGRRVSGEEKIEREGTGVGRCGEGEVGCWAARPKGKEVFFRFLFQTFSNSNFSFQIQTKILHTFSQNFINFLNFTQETKNYAKPNNDAQTLVVSKLIKLN